jgi:uncharacterized protein (DUF1778 family)
MSATARLDTRLQPSLKQEAERAATLTGARSLTEFVVQAIREKTASVLEDKEHITLSSRAFDNFIAACELDSMPGKALKQSASDHDAKGFV